MTRDEARRRAVEAAGKQWGYADSNQAADAPDPIEAAIAAYERAMADAGWRMVRDCGVCNYGDMAFDYGNGWNACRAAMLGEGE